MSETPGSGQAERFEVRVTSDSHFAWLRTRLAVERTMLAYMRTAVSLIAFRSRSSSSSTGSRTRIQQGHPYPQASWYLALAMILCGIGAAVTSLFDQRLISYLRSGGYSAIAGVPSLQRRTALYVITGVLILIGIFAFFSVLLSVE